MLSDQKDIRGRAVRVKIGTLGAWTVDQARKEARRLIVLMDQGINPNRRAREEAARGVTLADSIEMHLLAMEAKVCVKRSKDSVRDELRLHMGDWLRRPLSEITRDDCASRHIRITKGSGPYAANRVFWLFRACYNSAARRMDDLCG